MATFCVWPLFFRAAPSVEKLEMHVMILLSPSLLFATSRSTSKPWIMPLLIMFSLSNLCSLVLLISQCFSKPIKSLPRCTHNYLRTCTLHGFREQRDNLNYFWCTLLKMPLSWRSWRLKGLTWLVVISITKGKEEGKGRFFFQFEELDNFTICWVPYYLTVCQTSSGSCTRHLRGAEKCLQNTEHGQRLLLLELHKYVLDPHLEYDWDDQNWEGAGKLPLSHVDRYLVVAQLESSKQLQSAY